MGPGFVIQGLTVPSNTQVLLAFSLCYPQWVFSSSCTIYSSKYHLTTFQGQRAKKKVNVLGLQLLLGKSFLRAPGQTPLHMSIARGTSYAQF